MYRNTKRKFLVNFVIFCFILNAVLPISVMTSFAAEENRLSLDVTARKLTDAGEGNKNYKIISTEDNEIVLEYYIEEKTFTIEQEEVLNEIALVLDVSKSMENRHMDDLKKATENFIESFKNRDDVKIAIVPFSGYSNPVEYYNDIKIGNKIIGNGGKFLYTDATKSDYSILLDQAKSL